jgi:hypothetical protein
MQFHHVVFTPGLALLPNWRIGADIRAGRFHRLFNDHIVPAWIFACGDSEQHHDAGMIFKERRDNAGPLAGIRSILNYLNNSG